VTVIAGKDDLSSESHILNERLSRNHVFRTLVLLKHFIKSPIRGCSWGV